MRDDHSDNTNTTKYFIQMQHFNQRSKYVAAYCAASKARQYDIEEVKRTTDENVAGLVQTEEAASVVFTSRRDISLRLYVEQRMLFSVKVREIYSLPRMNKVIFL